MTNTIYVSLLFMVIGVVLLGCGVFLFFRQRLRIAQSLQVEGVVIELVQYSPRKEYARIKTTEGMKIEKRYSYRPVVRFQTQSGRTVTISPGISLRPAPYQVGGRVPVLYHPDHPQDAQINRFVYLWFQVLMLIFFGFFALGMGALGVIMLIV